MRFPYVRLSISTPTFHVPTLKANPQSLASFFPESWELEVAGCTMPVMAECDATPANQAPVGNKSGRTVNCVKFQKELPGLDTLPWPGELGQRIYENVSAQAWKMWEERMKMILNEYRLMPWQKEAQELIAKHMEDFFFGEGAALPPGYVPQQTK